MKRFVVAVGLVVGLGLSVLAGEPEAPKRGEELWATRLVEAARAQRWEEAARAWGKLRALDDAPPDRLVFLAAQVEVERKRVVSATDLLHTLLSRNADHLDALYLLARIEAKEGHLAETRALLLRAARAGQAVLRDLQASDERAFAPLRRDPRFLLDLMRASHGLELASGLRDPFASPIKKGPQSSSPDDEDPLGDTTLQELEARLRQLLKTTQVQAERRDLEALRATLSEVREVFQRFEERAPGAAQQSLERFRGELRGAEELFHSLQLQLWVTRGNHLLRLTAAAAREGEWERAERALSAIAALARDMNRVEREVFHATARRLTLRAYGLRRHVRVQRTIEGLELRVSGIALPPPDENEDGGRSVIVNDRIVGEGGEVPADVLPSAVEVRVEAIKRSTVTFSFEGVTFVRTLEPKPKK